MTEFAFEYNGHKMKAYFDGKILSYFDELGYDYALLECSLIRLAAIKQYEAYLKQQEANDKDWENTKWHLNQQFKVF